MSIEALIQAHTQALLENTEAVKLLTLSLAGRTPTAEKPKASKAEVVAAIKENLLGKEEPKVEVVEEYKDVEPAIQYETVRTLVLKLAPTQRDVIKALNAKHGIANLKVLLDKEDDFSTVNDQAKLEAVYADLLALEA